MDDNEAITRIEAALYVAGKPLSIKDIQEAAGTTSVNRAIRLARQTAKKINESIEALEVIELEDGSFVMQLKSRYNNIVRKFTSKPSISTGALKTLSCIVYMQPVSSSRLVEVRGSQVYQHLKLLLENGFIKYEKIGRNKVYRTSKKFQDYFGIDNIEVLKSNNLVLGKA